MPKRMQNAAEAKADSLREQADPKKLQAAIKARVALETEARKHVDATLALDSMTDRQVREAVVKKYSPADLAKASGEYVVDQVAVEASVSIDERMNR